MIFIASHLYEQISHVMDQFERQFEHLDVQTQTMDEAMQGVTTLNIPEVRGGEGEEEGRVAVLSTL